MRSHLVLTVMLAGTTLGIKVGRSMADEPKLRASLEGHSNVVWRVAFSPDGKIWAAGSQDGSVKLWDAASHKNTATWKADISGIGALAFSPDGKLLASGSKDLTIKLWDVENGKN